MKDTLQELKGLLVYVLEFVVDGQPRSVMLRPIDAGNGVILEETSEDSGVMRGKLVSGGVCEVPAVAITNVFASWWKVDHVTNQGHKTIYVDDAVIEKKVESAVDDPKKWDENGALKGVEGKDRLPPDTPNGRIIRGG